MFLFSANRIYFQKAVPPPSWIPCRLLNTVNTGSSMRAASSSLHLCLQVAPVFMGFALVRKMMTFRNRNTSWHFGCVFNNVSYCNSSALCYNCVITGELGGFNLQYNFKLRLFRQSQLILRGNSFMYFFYFYFLLSDRS